MPDAVIGRYPLIQRSTISTDYCELIRAIDPGFYSATTMLGCARQNPCVSATAAPAPLPAPEGPVSLTPVPPSPFGTGGTMNSQTPLPPPAPVCIPDYGFCGAPVVELEMLPTRAAPGEVIFFGVDLEFSRKFGIHNPGAATFIRERTAMMMPWAEVSPVTGLDIGIITAAEVNTAVRETRALSCHLARHGWRPALIGCDHTASLINLQGAIEGSGTVPIYLTFDAHYDIGRHHPEAGTHNGNFVDVLLNSDKVSRVINVGGRSWSTFASIYDMVPRFTSIPGGPQRMRAAEVIERLYWLQGRPLYVSIDADVLDPSGAPNACTPEPFGLSADELHTICHWIGSCCQVIGADLCELVPSDASACSEQVLMSCLQALFGEAREK